jgi:hypothetical protein
MIGFITHWIGPCVRVYVTVEGIKEGRQILEPYCKGEMNSYFLTTLYL